MNEESGTNAIPIVRCAVYSRSQTSCGIKACMTAAASHAGWVVLDRHIYRDIVDVDSLGLEILLLEASKQPRPFDMVITESTIDLAGPTHGDEIIAELETYGIRVFFVSLATDSHDAVLRYTVAFCRSLVDPTYVVSEDLAKMAEMQHRTNLASMGLYRPPGRE